MFPHFIRFFYHPPSQDDHLPSERAKSLRMDLEASYTLTDEYYTISGRTFTITTVQDPEELLDDLLDAAPDSMAVVDERVPYWSSLWPSSLGLAEHLIQTRAFSPGERVLEMGCGLGVGSLAACLLGAHVTATDYEPDALRFTRLNCLQNLQKEPVTEVVDWRNPPRRPRYDTLICADLIYEARFYDPIIDCFNILLEHDGRIFLAEPGREIARPFFGRLALAGWSCTRVGGEPPIDIYLITKVG